MRKVRNKRIHTDAAEMTLRSDAGRSRRFLAFACVVCMVALQCFMVLPALTEQAYAAGDLTIGAEYQDDYSTFANRTVSESFLDGINDRVEVTIEGEEEGAEPIVLEGPKLKAVLSEVGLSSKIDKVEVNGQDVKWSDGSYFLVSDEGGYQLYKKSGAGADLVVEGVGDIYVKRSGSVKPVSFSKKPTADKSNPTVGDTIKVSYKLSVDKFYKNSDDYDQEQATALTWSANDKVKLLTTSTSGTSGTVKVKVKKAGTITITPDSSAFPEMTSGVTVSFNGQPTTTKATTTTTTRYTTRYPSTTRSTYTPYRPTVRTGAGVSTTTGTTSSPTTATRPTQTSETLAPSFQTIKVKEVYLNAPAQDPQMDDTVFYDENGNPIDDPTDETDPNDEDSEDTGVTFPAAAGSAAVAAAACGAGAVGRIRRFRFDMSDAAVATAGSASIGGIGGLLRGGKGADKSASGAKKADASGKAAGAGKSAADAKKSRNPLNKFRKKN